MYGRAKGVGVYVCAYMFAVVRASVVMPVSVSVFVHARVQMIRLLQDSENVSRLLAR